MLSEKQVNHYAQASSIDSLEAERDIVLTYVLKILADQASLLLRHLAFKGGTCLKKIYFGKTGRFSMDLDFTCLHARRDRFKSELKSVLNNREHYGISFAIEEEYERSQDSYCAIVAYSHDWNSARFEIEVSFREHPILPVTKLVLVDELYFRYCGFAPFKVPCLQRDEVLAEKIRASFQRIRARDLFDLYLFATTPGAYDQNKVKALAVLKCWNARDPFEPEKLMEKITGEKYDWDDLRRLVRPHMLPIHKKIVDSVVAHYSYLNDLDDDLTQIVKDSKAHRKVALVKKTIDELTSKQ